MSAAGSSSLVFDVIFSGAHHAITLVCSATVADLRCDIEEATGVSASRQTLVGWPPKGTDDGAVLATIPRKGSGAQRILLMGTRDEEWTAFRAGAVEEEEEGEGGSSAGRGGGSGAVAGGHATPPHLLPSNVAAVAERIAASVPFAVAGFRALTWTAVLDIDYTLIDNKSPFDRVEDMARPYVNHLLTTLYEAQYDIVIWSATSLRWAVLKMAAIGVSTNPSFRLAGYLHRDAMATIDDGTGARVKVKPLQVLWTQCAAHTNPATTVMLDDTRHVGMMNPMQLLRVHAARELIIPANREGDFELLHLSCYLALIRRLPSLEGINHREWKECLAASGYVLGGWGEAREMKEARAITFISRLPPVP